MLSSLLLRLSCEPRFRKVHCGAAADNACRSIPCDFDSGGPFICGSPPYNAPQVEKDSRAVFFIEKNRTAFSAFARLRKKIYDSGIYAGGNVIMQVQTKPLLCRRGLPTAEKSSLKYLQEEALAGRAKDA
jgi:hypothetical protein